MTITPATDCIEILIAGDGVAMLNDIEVSLAPASIAPSAIGVVVYQPGHHQAAERRMGNSSDDTVGHRQMTFETGQQMAATPGASAGPLLV